MCGIAGFSRGHGGEADLQRMLEQMHHRGPDGSGTYVDDHVALGNVLLAIVDIGHGQQPVVREWRDATYVIVYNGEIYNYLELRPELEEAGFPFITNCDTEVALASFAAWGPAAASRLDGQWALAVWHVEGRQLILSRDPLGIKPLFYHLGGGLLAFASEPKGLLNLPGVPRRPNVDAIREYFLHGFAFAAGYSLSHRSFYEGIHALPPGHCAVWTPTDRRLELTRYFSYPLGPSLEPEQLEAAPRLLEAAMRRSTEGSMMGDAPIGLALSGGLDSSIITSVASGAAARRGQSPILASCIRYRPQMRNDDAAHASLLAGWLAERGTPVDLVFSEMDFGSYFDDLDAMISHFDEPHWEIKQLAMFNNYRKLKSSGAKVVLTGEGADELFFGYYHRFPGFKNPVIHTAEDLIRVWQPRLPVAGRLLAKGPGRSLEELMREAIDRFYSPFAAAGATAERSMQCWYLSTFLHWLLIDNDRCSMAFSLESRFPFLNRAVYELAFRLPPSAQVGAEYGQEKLLLREAFSDSLPEEIWRKRRKAPLPSPLGLGFHALVRDALGREIAQADEDVWQVVDKEGARWLLEAFASRLAALEAAGDSDNGGEELTSYLRLDEPWSVRTPHAFALLTLLCWWRINFTRGT